MVLWADAEDLSRDVGRSLTTVPYQAATHRLDVSTVDKYKAAWNSRSDQRDRKSADANRKYGNGRFHSCPVAGGQPLQRLDVEPVLYVGGSPSPVQLMAALNEILPIWQKNGLSLNQIISAVM
jgi:hypothetical protein